VVDTTGAGDAFVGAFALRRARGDDLRAAVEHAVAAGARAVRYAGLNRRPLTSVSPRRPLVRRRPRRLQRELIECHRVRPRPRGDGRSRARARRAAQASGFLREDTRRSSAVLLDDELTVDGLLSGCRGLAVGEQLVGCSTDPSRRSARRLSDRGAHSSYLDGGDDVRAAIEATTSPCPGPADFRAATHRAIVSLPAHHAIDCRGLRCRNVSIFVKASAGPSWRSAGDALEVGYWDRDSLVAFERTLGWCPTPSDQLDVLRLLSSAMTKLLRPSWAPWELLETICAAAIPVALISRSMRKTGIPPPSPCARGRSSRRPPRVQDDRLRLAREQPRRISSLCLFGSSSWDAYGRLVAELLRLGCCGVGLAL
jgi:hypothetical protein